ncbi:cysteine rich repeat-containing protein [Ensifer adhaerens]|uniref:cysteine rich repeat-containing protein n=1 Tax=Ensifer adhaerens TaxID=106592 RepID=UPI000CF15E4A
MKTRRTIAATLLIGLALTGATRAETLSYADAVTNLAQDCGADIKKFCHGLNLGNGRIADCLQKNAAKISPVCVGTITTVLTSISQREQAQAAYVGVCKHDIAQLCSSVKGDGYRLACLIKAERRVGKACNQAITDAGWR